MFGLSFGHQWGFGSNVNGRGSERVHSRRPTLHTSPLNAIVTIYGTSANDLHSHPSHCQQQGQHIHAKTARIVDRPAPPRHVRFDNNQQKQTQGQKNEQQHYRVRGSQRSAQTRTQRTNTHNNKATSAPDFSRRSPPPSRPRPAWNDTNVSTTAAPLFDPSLRRPLLGGGIKTSRRQKIQDKQHNAANEQYHQQRQQRRSNMGRNGGTHVDMQSAIALRSASPLSPWHHPSSPPGRPQPIQIDKQTPAAASALASGMPRSYSCSSSVPQSEALMLRWLRRHVRGKQDSLEAVLRRLDANDQNDGTVDIKGLAAALACVGIPLPDDRLGALVCIANDTNINSNRINHGNNSEHEVDFGFAPPRLLQRFWYASFTQDKLRSWAPRLVAHTDNITSIPAADIAETRQLIRDGTKQPKMSGGKSPQQTKRSHSVGRKSPASQKTSARRGRRHSLVGRGRGSRNTRTITRTDIRRHLPRARQSNDKYSMSDMPSQTPAWWRNAAQTESSLQAAHGSIVVCTDDVEQRNENSSDIGNGNISSVNSTGRLTSSTDLDAESHWSEFAGSKLRIKQQRHHYQQQHSRSENDVREEEEEEEEDEAESALNTDGGQLTISMSEEENNQNKSAQVKFEAQQRRSVRLQTRDAKATCLRGRLVKRMALVATQERAASAILTEKLKSCTLAEEAMRVKWAMHMGQTANSNHQPACNTTTTRKCDNNSIRTSHPVAMDATTLHNLSGEKSNKPYDSILSNRYVGFVGEVLSHDIVRDVIRYRAEFAEHRLMESEAALTNVAHSERELVEMLADGVMKELLDTATHELWAASDDIANHIFTTL